MELYVGDLVAPNDSIHTLASGCGRYDRAVVVCTNPFILVSEEGDMRWNTVKAEHYKVVGYADAETLKVCIDRLNRDLMQKAGEDHNKRLMKELFNQVNENVAKNDLEGFSRAVEILIKNRG